MKVKKNTLFQLPKKFALHFKIVFIILQIYVLILILDITTVNGFLVLFFWVHFSIVKLTRTLDKPIPRLSVKYVSVFAVSLIVLLFSIKGIWSYFFAVC